MFQRYKLFVRGLITNWIGSAGVVLTTSAFILFVLFELASQFGLVTNAYFGMVSYMVLPAFFVLGLLLVPIGWLRLRRQTGMTTDQLLSEKFPAELLKSNTLGSSLLATLGVLTLINVLFLGLGGMQMLHFMDEPEFCGTACHKVMSPEWATYQDSPHAHVRCVDCHVGEGAGALFNAKLNGLWQVISASLDLYDRPIQTPVHQLRPARETCEKCHWPDKFYGDRIKTLTKYGYDENSTPAYTTLVLKVGSGKGENTGEIHWHVAEDNEVRYKATTVKRFSMDWVEVRRGDNYWRYTNQNPTPIPAVAEGEHTEAEPVRSMDCVDCHNRATHIYEDAERAIDDRIAQGLLSTDLPFAKSVYMDALNGNYSDYDAADLGIENTIRGSYRAGQVQMDKVNIDDVEQAISVLQSVYRRNIHHEMKVIWGSYPSHLGHQRDLGCFRCHNPNMVDANGEAIPYDCTLCHSMLAYESDEVMQFMTPAAKGDLEGRMHQYLQSDFTGQPAAVMEEAVSDTIVE